MRRVSLAWVLGVAALMEGDLDVAEREFRVDIEPAEGGQAVRYEANSLWGLARVSADAGRISEAAELHQRALALRHRIGDRLGVVDSFVGLATAVVPVEPEEAARLVGAAGALRAETGATPTQREEAEVAAVLAAIREANDPRLMEMAAWRRCGRGCGGGDGCPARRPGRRCNAQSGDDGTPAWAGSRIGEPHGVARR